MMKVGGARRAAFAFELLSDVFVCTSLERSCAKEVAGETDVFSPQKRKGSFPMRTNISKLGSVSALAIVCAGALASSASAGSFKAQLIVDLNLWKLPNSIEYKQTKKGARGEHFWSAQNGKAGYVAGTNAWESFRLGQYLRVGAMRAWGNTPIDSDKVGEVKAKTTMNSSVFRLTNTTNKWVDFTLSGEFLGIVKAKADKRSTANAKAGFTLFNLTTKKEIAVGPNTWSVSAPTDSSRTLNGEFETGLGLAAKASMEVMVKDVFAYGDANFAPARTPEPGSLSLLALGALAALRRRA